MSRQSIVGQIYGYGVSLLAVLIILVTIHGIVNNIFRVVNPAAGGEGMRVMIMHHFGGSGMGGPDMQGMGMMPGGGAMMWGFGHHNRMFGVAKPSAGASTAPTTATAPGSMMQPGPGMGGPMTMQASMIGEGRFNAVRMLVIDIIMLIVGIALFQRTWDWLHKTA